MKLTSEQRRKRNLEAVAARNQKLIDNKTIDLPTAKARYIEATRIEDELFEARAEPTPPVVVAECPLTGTRVSVTPNLCCVCGEPATDVCFDCVQGGSLDEDGVLIDEHWTLEGKSYHCATHARPPCLRMLDGSIDDGRPALVNQPV